MSFMYTLSSHTHILTYSYTTEYKAFSYLATQTYLLESCLVRHKQAAHQLITPVKHRIKHRGLRYRLEVALDNVVSSMVNIDFLFVSLASMPDAVLNWYDRLVY